MKIIIITRLDGWMNTHFSHFGEAFNKSGNNVKLINYRILDKSLLSVFLGEEAKFKLRNERLEKIVKSYAPDIIIFIISGLKFHFEALKNYYKGLVIVYDVDGPGASYYNDLRWTQSIDFLFTVSKFMQRVVEQKGYNIFYLPHGVDSNFYKKIDCNIVTREKFGSTVSFIGRPTPRRVKLLSEITDYGLKLWGRRWSRKDECKNLKLRTCNLAKCDIFEKDVVKVYNCSDLYVNILREHLVTKPTILSLQSFAVPSCETCLIQEWVEELDEAFENGKEILSFKTKEEFTELVKKYSRDKETAKKIGEAGRKRILNCHTHELRAKELFKIIGK